METNLDSPRLVIGIDAGGTKTSAWLGRVRASPPPGKPDQHAKTLEPPAAARDQVEVLGQGLAGPGNPRAVGFEAATDNMRQAVEEAFARAPCEMSPAAALCIGAAGAGRPEEQARLESWCMAAGLALRVKATGDARPVLASAYADRTLSELKNMYGIALICGTGSMAWGCDASSEARSGGWGYLLGDEGSGYWIALEGLRAACRSAEGRAPDTRLLPAFMDRLQLSSPTGLIDAIYGEKFDRRRIASLAEVVVATAEGSNEQPNAGEPDGVAATIVERAACELCELVRNVAGKLQLGTRPWTLAITGGVLLHSASLQSNLQRQLQSLGAPTIVPVASPVQGALFLAASILD
ncbi:MAG: hypothetical protein IT422_00880 [Pirellulaceae bacterium]|jgi:N-acetylmuramic acid 6-phosphate etherase|nr:hypothetical protein [Pirellulaceae bacterium]